MSLYCGQVTLLPSPAGLLSVPLLPRGLVTLWWWQEMGGGEAVAKLIDFMANRVTYFWISSRACDDD